MELRLFVGYLLIALLVASAAGLIAWQRYTSSDRTTARNRRRMREASERRRDREPSEG